MPLVRVKLSTNFPEWPLSRQTPGCTGQWGNCSFFINEEIAACDYWVVYEGLTQPETTCCPPENTLLITAEPSPVRKYDRRFMAQFAQVLTCQREIKHRRVISRQQALPWMIGCRYHKGTDKWSKEFTKDYDELAARPVVPKTKLLSVISSAKALTPGHQQRLEFVQRLKQHFRDEIDVYGRGIRDFEDKWDVIAPYKYHVALENSQFRDYWTEKLSDALLADAYPFYSGCPNIGDYFAADVLTRLDLDNPDKAIQTIESGMKAHRFEATVAPRADAARRVLDEYNLFPTLEKIVSRAEISLPAQRLSIKPEAGFSRTLSARIKSRLRGLITR